MNERYDMPPRDIRLDIELRVDEEIDRQLDTRIASIYGRTKGVFGLSFEFVAYMFVPIEDEIPRGLFDERCVARGFRRTVDGAGNVWMRGDEGMHTGEGERMTLHAQQQLIDQFEATVHDDNDDNEAWLQRQRDLADAKEARLNDV